MLRQAQSKLEVKVGLRYQPLVSQLLTSPQNTLHVPPTSKQGGLLQS